MGAAAPHGSRAEASADLNWLGYSMGGPIALLLARRHPDRVRGLVLVATAAELA